MEINQLTLSYSKLLQERTIQLLVLQLVLATHSRSKQETHKDSVDSLQLLLFLQHNNQMHPTHLLLSLKDLISQFLGQLSNPTDHQLQATRLLLDLMLVTTSKILCIVMEHNNQLSNQEVVLFH